MALINITIWLNDVRVQKVYRNNGWSKWWKLVLQNEQGITKSQKELKAYRVAQVFLKWATGQRGRWGIAGGGRWWKKLEWNLLVIPHKNTALQGEPGILRSPAALFTYVRTEVTLAYYWLISVSFTLLTQTDKNLEMWVRYCGDASPPEWFQTSSMQL